MHLYLILLLLVLFPVLVRLVYTGTAVAILVLGLLPGSLASTHLHALVRSVFLCERVRVFVRLRLG